MCPPLWDNASCIPPTAGGDTAVLPCMRVYAGQYYAADSVILQLRFQHENEVH